MALKALLVADPVDQVARLTALSCGRLAAEHAIACDGATALAEARRRRPEIVVLSLELGGAAPEALIGELRQLLPGSLVLATFRELSVPQMQRLGRLGIDDFVAQPVDASEIFRAAALRFQTPCRQFPRFEVAFDVWRADDILLGRTLNVSAGGMRLALRQALAPGHSLLVELALPDGGAQRLRARWRLLSREGAPPQAVLARGCFENMRGDEQQRLLRYLGALE